MPNNLRSFAMAGPMFGRSVSEVTCSRFTLLGFMVGGFSGQGLATGECRDGQVPGGFIVR